jgi:hypothetical protein
MMAQRDHRVYASTTGGGCRSSVASEGDDRVEVRRAARWMRMAIAPTRKTSTPSCQ